ncbi:uncharacterized protein DDB_G0271670-like [Argonauta hians]
MKLTMDGECMYTPARSNIQLPVSNHRSSSASLYSSSSARNIMGPDSGARRAARLLDPRSLLKVKRKLFDLDNDSTTSSVELNNNNNNNNINNTSKTSVGITGSGVGSDFHQKMLEECEKKWNFDLVNCVPLDGRYEWVKMKPEEGPEFYRRSYVDLKRRVVDNSRENCPPKMADSGNYFKRQRRVTEDLSNGNNISCPFGKDITMLAELNGNNTCSIVINNNTTINNSTVIDISNLKKERNNNFGDDDHSNNDFHDVAMGIKSITTTASSTNNNLTPDSITATTTSRIQYNNNSSSNCSHNENINNCRNFNPYYNINSKDMDSTTTTTTLSGDETIINTGTTLLLGSHGDVCINNNNNNNTINIDNENNNNNNVSITEKSNNCDNTITTISTFSSSSPSSSSSSPSSLPNLCYSSSSPISSPSSSPLSLTLSPNSTTTTTTLALTPSSSSSTTIHTIPTQKDRKLLVKQTKIVGIVNFNNLRVALTKTRFFSITEIKQR